MKDIILLGGPNGAGKTTAARILLPEYFGLHTFVNADEVARDIAPRNVEAAGLAAGRLMIERMRRLVQAGSSFAVETTCAGRSYIPMLKECKAKGWSVTLYYLWLRTPEEAVARVAMRVSRGGHSIPSDVIRRRFKAGLWNMRHLYLPLADTAAIYDNSDRSRVLIAEKESGSPLVIRDRERWSRIEELTPWR